MKIHFSFILNPFLSLISCFLVRECLSGEFKEWRICSALFKSNLNIVELSQEGSISLFERGVRIEGQNKIGFVNKSHPNNTQLLKKEVRTVDALFEYLLSDCLFRVNIKRKRLQLKIWNHLFLNLIDSFEGKQSVWSWRPYMLL